MIAKNRTKETFYVKAHADARALGQKLTYSKTKSKKNPDYRVVEQRDLMEKYDAHSKGGFLALFESTCEGLDNVTVESIVDFGYGGDDDHKICVVGDREPTARELELVQENELTLAQEQKEKARTKADREAAQFEELRKTRPDLFKGLDQA